MVNYEDMKKVKGLLMGLCMELDEGQGKDSDEGKGSLLCANAV